MSTKGKIIIIIVAFIIIALLAWLIYRYASKSGAQTQTTTTTTTGQNNPGLLGSLSNIGGFLSGLFTSNTANSTGQFFCDTHPDDPTCQGAGGASGGAGTPLGDYCVQYPSSILCQG